MKQFIVITLLAASLSFSQYSLKVERSGGASHSGEANIFRASVMKDGTTISTIVRTIPFDVPFPASYIDKTSGNVVLTNAFDGFVEMLNADGTKIWEQDFFREMGPNYERTISTALGPSSVLFLTSDAALPNAIVRKFSANGAKEWETSLPYPMGYEIAMSGDEQTIVAGSYVVLEDGAHQLSTLMDRSGTVVGSAGILFRKAVFSDDNTLLALTSDREIVIVSNGTKKETARTAKKTDGIITDVLWDGSSLIVQESSVKSTDEHGFYFADPTFIRYSDNLKETARQKLEIPSYRTSRLSKKSSAIELNYDGTATAVTVPK